VVSVSEEDIELERLLTQLLRAIAPSLGSAASPGGSVQPAPDQADGGLPEISASEARALIELVSARGIAQGELAGLLGLEKSTVSRLAAGLERKGWIQRGRDEGNQRYLRLYLTPDGADVAARVWRAWQSRQARILGALSADERAGLSAGLRGLVRGLAAEGLLCDDTGGAPDGVPGKEDKAVGDSVPGEGNRAVGDSVPGEGNRAVGDSVPGEGNRAAADLSAAGTGESPARADTATPR
jgi:DNA-binding MarR family transcriptional regulator